MANKARTILVLGATGQQGGATVRQLLKDDWHVRAFTRDATQPAAKALAALGAEVIVGDMEDEASLTAAAAGAHGFFSVQPPSWNPTPESDAHEVRLGKLAADVALRAGVRHFIYTSVLDAENAPVYGRTGHKLAIEEHVWRIGLPATILRPTGFMENFFLPAYGIAQGALNDPSNPDVRIALIAVDDIGAIAARVFGSQQQFSGKTLPLAGDYKTPLEIAATLSAALGRAVSHVHVPVAAIRQVNPLLAALCDWVNTRGYPAIDLDGLRQIHPGLQTLGGWLEAGAAGRLRSLVGTT